MKTDLIAFIMFLTILVTAGCTGNKAAKKAAQTVIDTITVHDTGFTGIKQYMSGRYLIKEVSFKNGIREGVMKSFYRTGEVRQTFIYRNGLREDSAIWYYQEGQKFRSTPYKRDTIDGIQRQYYKNGQLKAKLEYSKGSRTSFLQEFSPQGKLIGSYPSLIVTVTDNYKTMGICKISLSLSDKSQQVRFWRGDLDNNIFDTLHCKKLKTIKGVCEINLKKGGNGLSHLGVIAEILTNFGNNKVEYKKIELPYNDLK